MNRILKRNEDSRRGLSLAPLPFREAVADLLKVKPESKSPKRKPKAKRENAKAS